MLLPDDQGEGAGPHLAHVCANEGCQGTIGSHRSSEQLYVLVVFAPVS